MRRRPRAIGNLDLWPVGPDIEREVAVIRRRKPVRLPVKAWRLGLDVKRQRTVLVVLQRLVLGAERIALERVRREKMMLVVKRQRPEAIYGRRSPPVKSHRVTIGAVQALAGRIKVLVEVLRLLRRIDEDIGLRDRGT